MSHDADWWRHPAAMISLRDDRVKEGDRALASVSRGGQVNRSYSNRDVRKRRNKGLVEKVIRYFPLAPRR
jgi:hypothetical protein